jgi:plastocyanin
VTPPSRREFLRTGGIALVGFGLLPSGRALARDLEVIEMRSDRLGARVWFDPIGLYVQPGATVRWIVRENVHTTTAYHPANEHHELRIPERAVPWDSGVLVHPGDHFDVTLTVPGVYDYYCAPHEGAGMVGRIVVGAALGPGAQPFDYWVGMRGTDGWRHVPEAARQAFPSVARILAERRVHPAGESR